jgi:pimeloyl-ACP methyl ester carboxylesterase
MPKYWEPIGNELTDFILCCHSLGGYIGGHYACIYKQHVRKLILLSPIGLRDDPHVVNMKDPQKFQLLKELGIVSYVWNTRISPFQLG